MVDKNRGEIVDTLIEGLQRLEYRGYDSAGLAVDGNLVKDGENGDIMSNIIVKCPGKVKVLKQKVQDDKIDRTAVFDKIGRAHV